METVEVCQSASVRRVRSSVFFGLCLLAALPVFGQSNPNVVEFIASPSHTALLPDGRPVVSRYELEFYQAGTTVTFLSLDIGKPAPQADGMIRVDYTKLLLTAWPYPGMVSEARVAAFGPNGVELSTPSNPFVYSCTFSLPVVSQSVPAGGGTGSFTVTGTSGCSWTATASASWLTVTSGAAGNGSGTVGFAAAANSTSSTRTATITVQNFTFTVTQAGTGSTSVPPPTTLTWTAIGDLTWASATNGWGPPERNRSNGEQGAADGRVLTLNKHTYASGLGAHAASDVRYTLNGVCSTFTADIGVDDEVGSKGSVIFKVLGDGAVLYTSGVLTGTSATQSITANVAGVKSLALVVTDGGNGNGSDHADWANARLGCSQSLTSTTTVRYVSDLTWSAATNGWGPAERDRSNGEQGATDGLPLTLNGRVYAKGIGAHAASDLRVQLNGVCTRFNADLGVDDEVGTQGTVVFQVLADGVKIFDSGVTNGSTATRSISLDLTGKRELGLVVTNGGDNADYDHADWADAKVTCTQ